MILQALYDYYQRKAVDPDSGIAPEGFVWKEIPFVIVINHEGDFISLEDTREGDGKKKRAKKYLLPKSVGRSGSNGWMTSFLLWDHYGYVLGHARSEGEKDQVMAQKQMLSFIKKIQDLPQEIKEDNGVLAVIRFYDQRSYEKVKDSDKWEECSKIIGCNMSFRLDGDSSLIPCNTSVQKYIADQCDENADGVTGLCLITGKRGEIARIHSDTPINKDSKKFVSFQRSSGYDSYGKEQAFNAPISKSAEFAYTTAMNMLLGKDSINKVQVGNTTSIFWSQKEDVFEAIFPSFFGYNKDNPDADVKAVKTLFESAWTGYVNTNSNTRFYILGLSPNSARIAVRFWHTGSIGKCSGNIKQHFDDLEIIRPSHDRGHYSLFWLLSAIAHEKKVDNIPPNLSGQIFEAVITGGTYPATMLQQTIRRIRATQDVTRVQAGILKAYLNRFHRIYSTKEKETITVALDSNNINPGYRLGRLFAVLEKIQEEANPGINATIRDRFYGAASSTPVTVFSQLLKLKNHHLAKLDNEGRKVNFERMLSDIFAGIDASMPAHLAMEDQARFAIGYYHQRQALFTKSSSNNESKN
ncbi:type I-C CRISPR-associated protein Cas8c/Csd1 [Pelodictyon luteolum]|uniref:CRISPR-associated protein, Csd1 family n=1 Tax=Chlorobium luteolum (strain DSM 273 / BCRC 81028 / 2530) TaxID=319225 RepID=Q3B3C4_CHLL3|nr:type I-C CRISPR-associated protein Cas8c/Csd1 [Pelodictyon luteolum]ABB24157.1 CRISPR-associated protein, Csd1 family [Pelodictyon luteolum DSM 273]